MVVVQLTLYKRVHQLEKKKKRTARNYKKSVLLECIEFSSTRQKDVKGINKSDRRRINQGPTLPHTKHRCVYLYIVYVIMNNRVEKKRDEFKLDDTLSCLNIYIAEEHEAKGFD